MSDIDELQAEIMRTLAHPRRLQIIHRLAAGPVEVGRLAADLRVSRPNVSQHLALMRASGVVDAVRTGRVVRYALSDPGIVAACELMRGVLARRLDRLANLSEAARASVIPGDTPIAPDASVPTLPVPTDRRPAVPR
ncbi:MAG TPA: metalloregulator ArsR/SmtB family transcription factor [Candidatus Limnocylindrales bacterium]|nr:metalloregulator ArsR/SmtB family transcription factor [Candidatus Limnocylindrales bacterium]